MKRRVNFTKLLALVTVISVIISICLVAANASSGTVYEVDNSTENNDSIHSATQTYDDMDNYGSISSNLDVDFWKITFNEEGMANFWLGNIPSGCNYDIMLYYNSSDLQAYSSKSSNKAELLRCHVYPGITYFLCIRSPDLSFSTSQYHLRIKNYPFEDNNFNAKIFTFNYGNYDYRPGATTSLTHLWNMNYDAGQYLNNSVSPAYSVFPNTSIFVFNGHGSAGQANFITSSGNITTLYAKTNSDMTTSDKAINAYSANTLDNVDLAIYTGGQCGITHSEYGNLVSQTIKQGVMACIAWKQDICVEDGNTWLTYFFANSYSMRSVEDATNWADAFSYLYDDYDAITDRYSGSSQLGALSIG